MIKIQKVGDELYVDLEGILTMLRRVDHYVTDVVADELELAILRVSVKKEKDRG